ncbi:MAG TPA: HAMP domain-containing sensor histidine kinase [Gemmatimonadaceae bacterium]|jgi:signal transduction histidine kinase|nr:HAMP domain-containing sensor histidine kinase [Gemmatimonadaceae bacterium]
MDTAADCPLALTIAAQLREQRDALTGRWLLRIADRVSLTPNRIFPTDDLIDHVPLLILGIAGFIEDPANPVLAETPVMAKAMELGALRHAQGFDEHQLLKEYEILGGILFQFLAEAAEAADAECSRAELVTCAHRLFQAIAVIQQATTTQFLMLARAQVAEREERLRTFNRALTHELRNRIGAVLGASQIMEMPGIDADERQRLNGVILRNVESMRVVLDNLLVLTGMQLDARHQRHVRLPEAAQESARQVRAAARARSVSVRIDPGLPPVEVSAAAVELCLTNLLANAIKYSDRRLDDRWVEVRAYVARADEENATHEVIVQVVDNGIGVPPEARERLFQRFFRAHERAMPDVEGTGLGLSIVRDTVAALGGHAWAEFPEKGSVFAFSLPCRRESDVAAVLG